MTKYKQIILNKYCLTSHDNLELAQRVAFSFDYHWNGPDQYAARSDQEIGTYSLVFDPNTLEINLTKCPDALEFKNSKVVDNSNALMVALKNPELNFTEVTSKDGKVVATLFDDKVTFNSTTSLLIGITTVPKELLNRISRSENKTDLPLVSFDYPSRNNYGVSKSRLVRVTKMDENYIQGFEVINADDPNRSNYKKFSIDVLETPVKMLEFIQS